MPEPTAHPDAPVATRAAKRVLCIGVLLMLFKYGVYLYTNSSAVLADTLESTANIVAGGMMLFAVWYSNRPADEKHPYGHGKVESLVVGLEGWMIGAAGLIILWESIGRFFNPTTLDTSGLLPAAGFLGAIGIVNGIMGAWLYRKGKALQNAALVADGKHLITDVVTSVGSVLGLVLVHYTGKTWLDPTIAAVMGLGILITGGMLIRESINDLLDHTDTKEVFLIRDILDKHVREGLIMGYHKVKLRHNGPFHWVDMHIMVEPSMTVAQGHTLASMIEHEIETLLSPGNATAHIEPYHEDVTNDARTET